MEAFADQHFIDLWRAAGIAFDDARGFDYWADKTVGNGRFLSRGVGTSRRGAFVWDMGRGIEVWLYITLPPGAMDMQPEDVEATYLQPGYRGDVSSTVLVQGYREDTDVPGHWWATIGPVDGSASPLVVPAVNVLESAERLEGSGPKECVISGLVMQARKSPEGLQDHENLRLLAARPARSLTPQQRRVMMAKSPWLLLEAEPGAPAMLRGTVRDINQTANFHTGKTLLKVTLDVPHMAVNLMGPKESFPGDMQPRMTMDVTAVLQVFL